MHKTMRNHRYISRWPGTTKTRITFSDLFVGAQKVIFGFYPVRNPSEIIRTELNITTKKKKIVVQRMGCTIEIDYYICKF